MGIFNFERMFDLNHDGDDDDLFSSDLDDEFDTDFGDDF